MAEPALVAKADVAVWRASFFALPERVKLMKRLTGLDEVTLLVPLGPDTAVELAEVEAGAGTETITGFFPHGAHNLALPHSLDSQ